MDLWIAAVGGFALGVGLVTGAVVLGWVRRYIRKQVGEDDPSA